MKDEEKSLKEESEELGGSVLEINRKKLDEMLIKNLDIDEKIKDKYIAKLERVTNKINVFSAVEKASNKILTTFGEKNLVIETEKRLIIFSLGRFDEVLGMASVGFNDIKKLDFDMRHKKINVKRKNVTKIHEHFHKKELEIPKSLNIVINSENWEHLFTDLEKLNCEKILH